MRSKLLILLLTFFLVIQKVSSCEEKENAHCAQSQFNQLETLNIKDNNNKMQRIPPLFISHGSPSLYLDKQTESYKFLASTLRKELKKYSIKAIVCVSAHWENSVIHVNTSPEPQQIYDFYGFPDEMYSFKYTPKGEPQVAQRVVELLKKSGIDFKENPSHGLDHGTWSPLSIVLPDADIPIVQVSLNRNLDTKTHFELGRALAPLQYENVLLIGSGSVVHNLQALGEFFSKSKTNLKTPDWAANFDRDVTRLITENTGDQRLSLAEIMSKSDPNLKISHPRTEHLMPLWVACGFGNDQKATVLHNSFMYSALSMTCYSF